MVFNFSKKFLLLTAVGMFIFFWPSNSYGDNLEIKMHNALGKAYSAASKQDKDLSIEWLKKAGRFAKKARNWQGCIDSGYGLLALDEQGEAIPLFDRAIAIAKRQKDWRGCIASGYAYNSVRTKLATKEKSSRAFKQAAKFSSRDGDWRGLIEAGNGLLSLGMARQAIQYYDDAFLVAKDIGSIEGLRKAENFYRKIAEIEKAKECERTFKSLSAPPPGWKPLGETVASPPQISPEIQKASRMSADKEIAKKNEWLLEQKKAEIKRSRQAKVYLNYYYPYVNYSGWRSSNGLWVSQWALYRLRSYYYQNGIWYWRVY